MSRCRILDYRGNEASDVPCRIGGKGGGAAGGGTDTDGDSMNEAHIEFLDANGESLLDERFRIIPRIMVASPTFPAMSGTYSYRRSWGAVNSGKPGAGGGAVGPLDAAIKKLGAGSATGHDQSAIISPKAKTAETMHSGAVGLHGHGTGYFYESEKGYILRHEGERWVIADPQRRIVAYTRALTNP